MCSLKVGIATAILAFFVANIVLYLFIYCVVKVSSCNLYGNPNVTKISKFISQLGLVSQVRDGVLLPYTPSPRQSYSLVF